MQWIVDSGGTKSAWVNQIGNTKNFQGINPNIHSKDFIINVLTDVKKSLNLTCNDTVVWYGAGCSALSSIEKLEECFVELGLKNVEINHDLLAACRAVLGAKAGIVGILGTGSNACFFNGKTIEREKISLGYVMGDEGGGAYFGKRLLQDYVNGVMPKVEASVFQHCFPADKTQLISDFYSSEAASAHLGQYAKVLGKMAPESEYKKRLISSGFEDYMNLFISPLIKADSNRIGFIGTVASIYEKELKNLSESMGLEFLGVDQNPIKALLNWHNSQ
jgi:N-acetylglucosamine kinase-like BadF-type ATPase